MMRSRRKAPVKYDDDYGSEESSDIRNDQKYSRSKINENKEKYKKDDSI